MMMMIKMVELFQILRHYIIILFISWNINPKRYGFCWTFDCYLFFSFLTIAFSDSNKVLCKTENRFDSLTVLHFFVGLAVRTYVRSHWWTTSRGFLWVPPSMVKLGPSPVKSPHNGFSAQLCTIAWHITSLFFSFNERHSDRKNSVVDFSYGILEIWSVRYSRKSYVSESFAHLPLSIVQTEKTKTSRKRKYLWRVFVCVLSTQHPLFLDTFRFRKYFVSLLVIYRNFLLFFDIFINIGWRKQQFKQEKKRKWFRCMLDEVWNFLNIYKKKK